MVCTIFVLAPVVQTLAMWMQSNPQLRVVLLQLPLPDVQSIEAAVTRGVGTMP